ncbi:MAG: CDP-alcohol phosphatidyltransferase family protein [Phycisphaerales bacterium]
MLTADRFVPSRRWLVLVPNAFTVLRLALAAWYPFVVDETARLVVIVVAGLSDLIDGFLARRFNLGTWIGAILDGTADKLFTLVVLAMFLVRGELLWWELLILLTRDLTVSAFVAYAAYRRAWDAFKDAGARPLGKLTTLAFFAFMVAVLAAPEWRDVAFIAAAGLSAASAIDYAIGYFAEARARPRVMDRKDA